MRLLVKSAILAVLGLCIAPTARAQVIFERDALAIAHGLVDSPKAEHDLSGQQTYTNAGWRKKMLAQFPRADLDGDGVLTEAEAIQYHLSQVRLFTPQGKELFYLPKTVSRYTARVPMRDGESLPTEIYLPGGDGPWPVILCRTARGRIDSALDYGNEILRRGGFVFIGQDLTPQGDFIDADQLGRETGRQNLTREDRAQMNANRSRRNAGQDGYDAIEWIAQQPWCNGKIAMTGYSEASMQSKQALAQLPPHLAALVTSIGSVAREGSTVRRGGGGRGGAAAGAAQAPQSWTPPSATPTTGTARFGSPLTGGVDPLVAAADKVDVFLNDRDGWFDRFGQGGLDEWNALKHNGKSVLIMGYADHGPLPKDLRQPPAYGDCDLMVREIEQFGWLTGAIKEADVKSRLYYFLMGDATDPTAPGNVWKVTDAWPPANTATSWYLTGDGTLQSSAPLDADAARTYTYDPNNPVQIVAGPTMPPGPVDLRSVKDRADVLRFDSAPLAQPVEFAGRPVAEIYVSTDAPDTVFIVSLVDVYPDGYEWQIRDAAFMLRFRDGVEKPKPAKPGEVYKLTFQMPSTALVLNKGHRLGVRVMSSANPAYEVHPNTWDAIASYKDAKVAKNTVHASAQGPSRIILPVVAPGTTQDYVAPKK